MQYPILTTGFTPNPAFTIAPVTNPNMMIDNMPVVTSFVWKSNSDPSSSGTIQGNSTSTFIDGLPVVICDTTVSVYYTPTSTSVLSD